MTPSKYAPYEVRNSMFLPLMKKALMGGIGGRRQKTRLSLSINYKEILQIFLGEVEIFFAPFRRDYASDNFFSAPSLKIGSAGTNEKKSGHA